MDRVFLDANVLFSAAYRSDSGLLRLWSSGACELVSSRYALEEALRNLDTEGQRSRLAKLVAEIELVEEPAHLDVPQGTGLPEKDLPILAAAIASGSSHLLTGDRRHFGGLFNQQVQGVLVQTPRGYLGHH